mgnify:CR=1 FL=1
MSPIVSRIVILMTAAGVLFAAPADTGNGGGGAQDGQKQTQQHSGSEWMFPLLIVGMFALMYFLMIRPQRKQEKQRREMIAAVKRGDRVVTIGGLHAEVVAIGEETIDVRPSKDAEGVLTFNKGAISQVVTDVKKDK